MNPNELDDILERWSIETGVIHYAKPTGGANIPNELNIRCGDRIYTIKKPNYPVKNIVYDRDNETVTLFDDKGMPRQVEIIESWKYTYYE